MPNIEAGQRVMTPSGPGVVNYVRMAPPDYATPAVVSVWLDAVDRYGYGGSVFGASDVSPTTIGHPDDSRIRLSMDHGEWTGTLAQLIADNHAPNVCPPDPEMWDTLRSLAIGETCTTGGGAAAEFRFTRLA